MPEIGTKSDKLSTYKFYGLDLDDRGDQAVGECPWCGKEGKFSVKVSTGQWKCWSCAQGNDRGGGNELEFIRQLHARAVECGVPFELRENRSLLDAATFAAWGVHVSPITREVLVAGHEAGGKLTQLYKYAPPEGKKSTLMVPRGTHHALFGVPLYDPKKPKVWVVEGLWNCMALYEVLRQMKRGDEGYVRTGSVESSLYSKVNILGIPGAGSFNEKWSQLLDGKDVTIITDSDHPREGTGGKMVEGAGYAGLKRTCVLLSRSEGTPKSVSYLKWGDEGYDPNLAHGFDVRDAVKDGKTITERVHMLGELLEKVTPVPDEWGKGRGHRGQNGSVTIECAECESWPKLLNSWKKALQWMDGLEKTLAVMLCAPLSTKAVGDQLWIRVISPAGSAKSALCAAISTNKKYCKAVSTFKGFYSGYMDDKEGKEDFSLLHQLRDKTLVMKEGGVLLELPNLAEVLAQARDIYDRSANSSFKNKASRDYDSLNITWILCGTSALHALDQSDLGERFLTCTLLDEIDEDVEDDVLWRVANRADRSMSHEANGSMETQHEPAMLRAMQLTGGYVAYLRQNAQELLSAFELTDEVKREVIHFAKFTAFMRARPSKKQDEVKAEREFAARLVSQMIRLTKCLTVVMQRPNADAEVLRRVQQVAMNTSKGRTLNIVEKLHEVGEHGLSVSKCSQEVGRGEVEVRRMVKFLYDIKAVCLVPGGGKPSKRYCLTPTMERLYESVTRLSPSEEK